MIVVVCILKAVKPDLGACLFWRLLLTTAVMLAFGHLGEQYIDNPLIGFASGMADGGFMLCEIFASEAGQVATGVESNEYVNSEFNTSRFIVTFGWSFYPLSYLFVYLLGTMEVSCCSRSLSARADRRWVIAWSAGAWMDLWCLLTVILGEYGWTDTAP